MVSTFWKFLFRPRAAVTAPVCRLSEAEALQIATSKIGDGKTLVVRNVMRVDGRTEWQVGTATVGRGTIVRIDDATGDVIETEVWGKR
jgi:hypothetical protein